MPHLKIHQQPELPFYQEVVDTYQAQGYQKTNDVMIKIQAENTKYKSAYYLSNFDEER